MRKDTAAQLAISEKTASARYLDARYRYLQERKLLDAAKTRLSSEAMEHRIPQKATTIRDPAEPPSFPSQPKILLNLFLGAVAGLVLGVARPSEGGPRPANRGHEAQRSKCKRATEGNSEQAPGP